LGPYSQKLEEAKAKAKLGSFLVKNDPNFDRPKMTQILALALALARG
jgi:hypothetical protein